MSHSESKVRAHTPESPLYDNIYKEFIVKVFTSDGEKKDSWEIPTPENITDPDALTANMIKHAFFYAHYRVKYRKVTPRSVAFLKKYRDTAEAAMKTPSRDKEVELITLNQILHSEVTLLKQPNEAEIKGQAAMKELIQLRYCTDYGDHMAENCKRFRDKALEQKIEGIDYFTGSEQTWTAVQKKNGHRRVSPQ